LTGRLCSINSLAKTVEPLIAADGGMDFPPPVQEDPYQALDDLMPVVEVLCPVWAPRDAFRVGSNLLL
jgi:hypothetical protein